MSRSGPGDPVDGPGPRARGLVGVDEVELTIEKLVAGGDGLGRWKGIPIFVPRSAPGDRLRVEIVERRPDYGRGEVLEILEAGPGRREPPCPHFGDCGGCDLQHLDDARQVELKAAAVRETLRRLGGIELPRRTEILAGRPWGYRTRAQIHSEVVDDEVRVGYHRRGSNDLVPIRECRILVPELEGMIPGLADHLSAEGPRRLDLLAGDDAVTTAPPVEGLPVGEVALTVGDRAYQLDARCFFQAHRSLTPKLVERVVGDGSGELALDLYAGVGLFSLPLAGCYSRVVAVESGQVAARFARRNARGQKLSNVEIVQRDVETYLRDGVPPGVDRIVVDPPRGGLSKAVRRTLLVDPVDRLTYVSCHPATLARDLRQLTESGFQLESMCLIDLFPQSGHMEVVAQLAAR